MWDGGEGSQFTVLGRMVREGFMEKINGKERNVRGWGSNPRACQKRAL